MALNLELDSGIDWTDIITVYVGEGDNKKKFFAHASILERIPFFDACLRSRPKESRGGVVHCHWDISAAFEEVLYWAYHNEFEVDIGQIKNTPSSEPPELYTRICTYLLARQLCAEEISNAAIETLFFNFLNGNALTNTILASICGGTKSPDDPLRRLYLYEFSRCVNGLGGFSEFVSKSKPFYDAFCKAKVEHMEFMLQALTEFPQGTPLGKEDKCTWHIHTSTPKCSEKAVHPQASADNAS